MILTGNSPPIPTPQIITNAIAEGAAKEMIVVVPQVFTHPTKAGATDFGDYESSQGYDNFVDDIVDSLMQHIESKYSVATGRENTASSMERGTCSSCWAAAAPAGAGCWTG